MKQDTTAATPTLEEVQQQFIAWRKTKKRSDTIPPRLWEAAVSLAGQYSNHKISRALRLSYTELRHRLSPAVAAAKNVGQPQPTPSVDFMEYAFHAPPRPECLIEMENRHGDKMRIFIPADNRLDLMCLGKSFWNREP